MKRTSSLICGWGFAALVGVVLGFSARPAQANDVENSVTVSTSSPPPAVGLNEGGGDGLNWTGTGDTKRLKVTLNAPANREIKCASQTVISEGIAWDCADWDTWAASHLYTSALITSKDFFRPLFSGPIRGGAGGPGGGPPPTWYAGVIQADIQGDADNDSTTAQRPPATAEAERKEEEVAEQGGTGNATGLIVPLNRGRQEGDTSEDYLHVGIMTSDPDLVQGRLVLKLPTEAVPDSKVKLSYDTGKLKVYKADGSIITSGSSYDVSTFGQDNVVYIEGTTASTGTGANSIQVTLTPKSGDVSRDKIIATVVTVEIDAYMQGDDGRKLDGINALADPTNVIASGYVKYKAEVFPATLANSFYYAWTANHGTLVAPTEGSGTTYNTVKWDGPNVHEQETTLTVALKKSQNGPSLISIPATLKTIRPYVVRVKFVDDTIWDEEHDISDGYHGTQGAEFDAIADGSGPVCYVKNCGMQFEVDLAGSPTDDSVNNLSKKTEVIVEAVCTYGGNRVNTAGDALGSAYIDSTTENWAHVDFDELIMETTGLNAALPNHVTEFEDFAIEWTFKVKNSSGNWVAAYTIAGGYSQKTEHHETSGTQTHGLYVIYSQPKFNTGEGSLTAEPLDYACEWANNASSENDCRTDLMNNGFVAHYDWDMQCHRLSSDFVRMCKSLGITASLHTWASNASPGFAAIGDMCYQRTKAINPVGPSWPNNGQPTQELEWSWHQWAESGSKQYDPSGNAILEGFWGKTWGDYEDDLFKDYERCTVASPFASAWDANQGGQTQGCESRGVHTTPVMSPWYGPNN